MPALDETFETLLVDWDAVVGADSGVEISHLWARLDELCRAGVHVFVIIRAGVEGLAHRRRSTSGGGRMYLCCNHGGEVFAVTETGPRLRSRWAVTGAEQATLRRASALAARALRAHFDVEAQPGRPDRVVLGLVPRAAPASRRSSGAAARRTAPALPPPAEVVAAVSAAARAAGLGRARIAYDGDRVEIGLSDASDAARFAARWAARRGITGQLVLVVADRFGSLGGVPGPSSPLMVPELARARFVSIGVEPAGVPAQVTHLGGGRSRLLELLDHQIQRRGARRVPQIDPDPQWVVTLPEAPAHQRVAESLGTLGNGWAATRGSREDPSPASAPLFAVAGVYDDEGRMLRGPIWTRMAPAASDQPAHGQLRRSLDLRTGTLVRRDGDGGMRSLRFVSATAPHAMALRAELDAGRLEESEILSNPGTVSFERAVRAAAVVARTGGKGPEIAVAARDQQTPAAGRAAVERLAAWADGAAGRRAEGRARRNLATISRTGFDALLAAHRGAWARRWRDAEVQIEGGADAEADQLAARFAVFHLLSAAAETGEAAVGARGLTGDAYEGHVFWDADVFVLPALAAIRPKAARAMLEYRIRRLPAARAEAHARGLAGARFPWESAGGGRDVTPRLVHGLHGEPIPIATGPHEEHIVADVAWSADRYASWTGDRSFLVTGPGRDLLIETARYWASRARVDRDGHGHLYGVMGPDEYHEVVDDNAFTNMMARWNLERAAALVPAAGDAADVAEASRWRDLAARLVDGWDPSRQIYEQFAGYFALEPLLVADVARPPVAIDVLLGPRRVSGSQLIKQADVLMLHHLLPTAVVPGSLRPCLDFYEPRTAHGSSLSPAISASLMARAGQPDAALPLFRLAARLDLDDLTGTTAGGLHLATMGGVWQALAHGFLGLRLDRGELVVDPQLPQRWSALSMRLRLLGRAVGIRATHHEVTLTCGAHLPVRVAGRPVQVHRPPRSVLDLSDEGSRRRRPT